MLMEFWRIREQIRREKKDEILPIPDAFGD